MSPYWQHTNHWSSDTWQQPNRFVGRARQERQQRLSAPTPVDEATELRRLCEACRRLALRDHCDLGPPEISIITPDIYGKPMTQHGNEKVFIHQEQTTFIIDTPYIIMEIRAPLEALAGRGHIARIREHVSYRPDLDRDFFRFSYSIEELRNFLIQEKEWGLPMRTFVHPRFQSPSRATGATENTMDLQGKIDTGDD